MSNADGYIKISLTPGSTRFSVIVSDNQEYNQLVKQEADLNTIRPVLQAVDAVFDTALEAWCTGRVALNRNALEKRVAEAEQYAQSLREQLENSGDG